MRVDREVKVDDVKELLLQEVDFLKLHASDVAHVGVQVERVRVVLVGDENSHKDQPMDRQRVDVHHWDRDVRVKDPGAAAVNPLEILLGKVADPVD